MVLCPQPFGPTAQLPSSIPPDSRALDLFTTCLATQLACMTPCMLRERARQIRASTIPRGAAHHLCLSLPRGLAFPLHSPSLPPSSTVDIPCHLLSNRLHWTAYSHASASKAPLSFSSVLSSQPHSIKKPTHPRAATAVHLESSRLFFQSNVTSSSNGKPRSRPIPSCIR